MLLIFLFSLSFADDEPFYNYKHDKVYHVANNDLIPVIDGKLNDSCWVDIEVIDSFTQVEPNYNDNPSEKSNIKIIQDKYAIYIAAKLFDSNPELIAQKYVNRDDFVKLSMSDWFSIGIDGHHDHQTGHEFLVNAAGVQFDSFLFDDTDEEMNWDGVWESMVSIDDKGWNVEIRIPFSSLRFSSSEKESEWGINIKRYIHRKNEYIEWIVLPKGTNSEVSKFGHIRNIKNIKNETAIEVIPHISTGQMSYDDLLLSDINKTDYGHIPYDTTFYYPRLGLDMKIHLSNNTILDLTTLPDFGQIESDPADINFTYYDTYFDEKRRFFLENITLFDTPIDLFHTRRIGENPNYELAQYDQDKHALILGAGKITGKSDFLGFKDVSYGFIAANTISKKRQNKSKNIFSINLNESKHRYLITRITKDFLSGNSYMGLMGTRFKNDRKKSSIISYDGMYNLFNNRLFIDSQIIYSVSDKNGMGAFLEFEYSIPNFIQLGSNMEYYDQNLDVNDIGYLIRNDLLKLNNSLIYNNDNFLSLFMIRNFSMGLNHIIAKNMENILLAHILNPMLSFNFKNYSFIDISYNLSLSSYEDRLYDFTDNVLSMNKIGKTPRQNMFQLDFGNNPNGRLYFDISLIYSDTEIKEKGASFNISIGANLSKDSDISVFYSNISGNEKYRFLDQLEEDGRPHFIFAESNNFNEKWIIRYNKFFKNGINLQLYQEYFIEKHKYSNYSELSMNSEYPTNSSDYIIEGNFYCQKGQAGDECPLDPNSYIWMYPNYNELNLNLILSWEYSTISNLYFIYRVRKAIIGKRLDSYLDFINYRSGKTDLSEMWNDQSIYIKIDYWFDF